MCRLGFDLLDREALLAEHLTDLEVLELGQYRLRARNVVIVEKVVCVPARAVVADLHDPWPDGFGRRGDVHNARHRPVRLGNLPIPGMAPTSSSSLAPHLAIRGRAMRAYPPAARSSPAPHSARFNTWRLPGFPARILGLMKRLLIESAFVVS
jgi:hypothetical protein